MARTRPLTDAQVGVLDVARGGRRDPITAENNEANDGMVRLDGKASMAVTIHAMFAMAAKHDELTETGLSPHLARRKANQAMIDHWKSEQGCTRCPGARVRYDAARVSADVRAEVAAMDDLDEARALWAKHARVRSDEHVRHAIGDLELHHRDPAEKAEQGRADHERKRAVNLDWPHERVLVELAKCDVLCKPCHRTVTGYERGEVEAHLLKFHEAGVGKDDTGVLGAGRDTTTLALTRDFQLRDTDPERFTRAQRGEATYRKFLVDLRRVWPEQSAFFPTADIRKALQDEHPKLTGHKIARYVATAVEGTDLDVPAIKDAVQERTGQRRRGRGYDTMRRVWELHGID